jgi:hypothetical protein
MPIPQLSIFCLIQGIINCVQINTYWNFIVQIAIFINLAINILLLASKKFQQYFSWVITVFTVFRLLNDFVCLYNYEFGLSLCKIVRSTVILLLPLLQNR